MKSFEDSIGWTFPDLNVSEFSTSISDTPEITRLNFVINELNKKISEKDEQIALLNNNIAEITQAITAFACKIDSEIENSKNDVRNSVPSLIDHVKYIAKEVSKKIINKEITINEKAILSIIEKILEVKLESVTRTIILNSNYYHLLSNDVLNSYKNITFIEDPQLANSEIFCTDGVKTVKFDMDALISSYMD